MQKLYNEDNVFAVAEAIRQKKGVENKHFEGSEGFIEDTAKARVIDMKVKGDIQQDTSEAMPSIDYPSEIKIPKNSDVKVKSKNIFIPTLSVDGTNITNGNNTTVLNGDEFTLTANSTSDVYFGQVTAKDSLYINSKGFLYDVSNMNNVFVLLTNTSF